MVYFFYLLLGAAFIFFIPSRSFEWKAAFEATTQKSETYWFSEENGQKKMDSVPQEEIEDLINLFKMCTRAIHWNVNIQLHELLSHFNWASLCGRIKRRFQLNWLRTMLKHIIYEYYRCRCVSVSVCVYLLYVWCVVQLIGLI